ncbi:MAG: ABC transporter permease [Candidatus Marinimicrobia bacterium]|nr:ABC transporter permease [Candidatus Neomarinimicrobiota bacterium]
MNLDEGVRIAFQTIKSNKLRTFLTTLGIVIGVTSVIGMMSLINALEAYMNKTLSVIGGNTFWIQKYPAVRLGKLDKKYRLRKDITVDHAEAIKKYASAVSVVSPEAYSWGKELRYKDKKTNPNILVYGSDENWLEINMRFLKEGRFFNRDDIHYKRNVVVIGTEIAEKLFPYTYPIDEFIKIDNIKFKIIGVLEEKGSIFGQSQDNFAVIPISTFMKIYGKHRSIGIAVKAINSDFYQEAMDQSISILRTVRKVPPGDPNDFEVVTQDSIMQTLKNLTGFIFVAAVVICSISLIVGGIGIMNIMLVAVTERTREIGIRKAIGAKRIHILYQFLTETIVICLAGGIIGIILGSIIGVIAGVSLKLPPIIPVWSIFLGVGFSIFVGLLFGIYPSMKAARLNPIEALRYE